ncbi:hypothetical protein [Aliiroseovarius crassostreae]|uniref:hypothetical protein n=1 Tax=Aliiroseovarius crassostreae TaxID=154981 RepID=UPI003C7ADDD1
MAHTQAQYLSHSFRDKEIFRRDGQARFKPGWWLLPAVLLAVPVWIGIFKLIAWLF